MSFTTLQSTGKGNLRYRLMIEGWPEMFVTDPSITATSIADGRAVLHGLLYEGLQIHDRIVPAESSIVASGNTFKIVPTSGTSTTDPVLASLSTYPSPVGMLEGDLDDADTTIALKGGATLSNSTNYHIGTEVIRTGTFPTISRTKWDTLAQEHNTNPRDQTRNVYIYDRPPTMEGRRCYLYAYGRSDTVTSTGTLIWRGIVNRAPKQDTNSVAWLIEALPITHVLKQTVAGFLQDTHPVGIYHHSQCQFGVLIQADTLSSEIYHYPNNEVGTGDVPIDTEETLIEAVNSVLLTALNDSGIDALVDSIHLIKDSASPSKWSFVVRTGTLTGFRIVAGSPLIGWVDSYHDGMFYPDPNDPTQQLSLIGGDTITDVQDNTTYYVQLGFPEESYALPGADWQYQDDGVAAALGYVASVYNSPNPAINTEKKKPKRLFVNDSSGGDLDVFNPWRLYVDQSLEGATAVHIEGTYKPNGIYEVVGTGVTSKELPQGTADFNYIELEPYSLPSPANAWLITDGEERFKIMSRALGFAGRLSAGNVIRAVRSYGYGVSVVGFVENLKTASVKANDGDTPFITDADIGDWVLLGDGITPTLLHRQFAFTRELAVGKILERDLQLAGHLMRIESDGRIGIIALPILSETHPVDATHTISGDDIITPASSFGAWPTVEPQRDGLITTVAVQEMYDPVEDSWIDHPVVYQDADAIATHKTRGKSRLDIRPYSLRLPPPDPDRNLSLAKRILRFFARDYTVVTIKVPWTKFGILCGDAVSLTHRLIPDGSGSRGMTARRGVCIERRWNLDPRGEEHGTLTFWIQADPIAGYAPGGLITDQTDNGSNNWSLTLAPGTQENTTLSTNDDGRILDHFAAGYKIRIVEDDDGTPTVVTGSIVSITDAALGTCVVQLDGVWTPGVNTWWLEYDDEGTVTDAQLKYAYVAASDLLSTTTGNFARRLT